MSYSHLLVAVAPTPESHALLKKAVAIARPENARLSLITLSTDPEMYNQLAAPMMESLRELMQEETQQFLQSLADAASRAGSTIEEQGQDDGAEPVAQVTDDPQADDVRQGDRLRPPAIVEDEGVTREQFRPGDDDQAEGDTKGQAHGNLIHRNRSQCAADRKGQEDTEADIGPGQGRDLETAEISVKAAQTGHLVLSTLHTNDAPSALTRMLDLGVPAYLLNATVLGIMAQRLVRILCPHCKEAHPPTADEEAIWDHLVTPWKAPRPKVFHRAVGCIECRMTGYMGRIGLYEILLMSPELKKTTSGQIDLARIREQAIREGMKPLRLSGALKVAAGITTLAEVVKVAPPAEAAD